MPSTLVLHTDTRVRILMERSSNGARQVDYNWPECGIVLGECRAHWSTRMGETRRLDLFPGDVWCSDGAKQEGGFWTRPINKMIVQFANTPPVGLSQRFGGMLRRPPDAFTAFLRAIAAFGVRMDATERLGRESAIAAFAAFLETCERSSPIDSLAMTSRRLNRVREFVDAHLDEMITLGDMANVAALSQSHFSRSFRRATGLTPYAYVREQRLQRAARLLEAGHPVGLTAADTGFGSAETLRRHFVKRYGATPSQWARRHI